MQPSIISIVLALGAVLLAFFFIFLHENKKQRQLIFWAAGWLLMGLSEIGGTLGGLGYRGSWGAGLMDWLTTLGALVFLCGAWVCVGQTVHLGAVLGAAAVASLWMVANRMEWVGLPLGIGAAFVMFLAARVFRRDAKKRQMGSDGMLSVALAGCGVMLVLRAFQPQLPLLARIDLRLPALVPELFVAVLMVMLVHEEDRRRVERNILALSNLNLATSGFGGGEIEKMLLQALGRVLDVGQLSIGGLCVRNEDGEAPRFVVATRLSESFCTAMAVDQLDEYFVQLVARLGGLVVFRDLGRDVAWQALEREGPFREIRRLLLAEGLKTVVGISLQSKEQVIGVMLLADKENRQFTPPDLRLLLALGHQIGMAVENGYLVHQTARRGEELHILNEIGRVLSSTLEVEALLENLQSEMRRLFASGCFFVALYDSRRNGIQVEVEVADNERLPKHHRPAGDYVAEHLIRTREPLLIRDHLEEELQRRGVRMITGAKSFCGVPLVLYERSMGAIGVYSPNERGFTERDLDLLRILASEAGIALENARLFSEEQRKTKQLALLNSISRHAISTLGPEEMVGKIAGTMDEVLPYDYMCIALMEMGTREIVVRAEAGKWRGARGERYPLGEKLIGQAARTMKVASRYDVPVASSLTIQPAAAAAMALPVIHGGILLGVLNVETANSGDIGEEDAEFLMTLADLIATALNSALLFQKAQEQAITDGLTGVKTHRYLMEAFSAEWKRSTRSGRAFSLVLMDLDRFKAVNDYYGHVEGDVVLQVVGRILEHNCRRSDVVARYGGDEFVILMPETTGEQAYQLAEKLRGWVAGEALLAEKGITASFGIAAYQEQGSTPQELLQAADEAMYLSKRQGGNFISTGRGTMIVAPGTGRSLREAPWAAGTGRREFTTGPEGFGEVERWLEHLAGTMPELKRSENARELPRELLDALGVLGQIVESFTPMGQGHAERVAGLARLLGRAAGLSEEEIESVGLAAMLHDIGQLSLPKEVLGRDERLFGAELALMRQHPVQGAELLSSVKALAEVREMIRHQHEHFDGSGYPDRLKGQVIPIGSRILAIAETCDAITSSRPYRPARSLEGALEEMQNGAGTQFDAVLLALFRDVVRKVQSIKAEDGSGT
jgi:diguanylate cyclase (GGDEF)-like protein